MKVIKAKPTGFKQSWSQRTRWTVGHIQCIEHYTKDLARATKEHKTKKNILKRKFNI